MLSTLLLALAVGAVAAQPSPCTFTPNCDYGKGETPSVFLCRTSAGSSAAWLHAGPPPQPCGRPLAAWMRHPSASAAAMRRTSSSSAAAAGTHPFGAANAANTAGRRAAGGKACQGVDHCVCPLSPIALAGDRAMAPAASKEACCATCAARPGCAAGVFDGANCWFKVRSLASPLLCLPLPSIPGRTRSKDLCRSTRAPRLRGRGGAPPAGWLAVVMAPLSALLARALPRLI